MQSICVYCGSSDRIREAYLIAARQLGAALARRGAQLVYGAGSTGMMGAVADGALENGGQVIGVIPELFVTPQLAHYDLSRMEIVPDMHVRKARMAALADAFIALPGGFGTLEEVFEIITWAQIGIHNKPIGLLNTDGYFEPLLAFIEHASTEGFIYTEHQELFSIAKDPDSLLASMKQYEPPAGLDRWLTRDG